MAGWTDYSGTPAANSTIAGLSAADGTTLPSSVNNQMRQLASDLSATARYADAGGTVDAITAALVPAITAYADGMVFFVKATGANTSTAPTINLNGVAARTITKFGGQALVAGDIFGDEHIMILAYRSAAARMELLNPAFPKGAATTTKAGVLETATDAEFVAQSSTTVALTPSNLAAKPCFSAKASSSQTIPYNTTTKVTFATESFDVGGYFASSAWTPPSGRARLTGYVQLVIVQGTISLHIYKNGSVLHTVIFTGESSISHALLITAVVECNGTDEFDIRLNHFTAGSVTVASASYFCGEMI